MLCVGWEKAGGDRVFTSAHRHSAVGVASASAALKKPEAVKHCTQKHGAVSDRNSVDRSNFEGRVDSWLILVNVVVDTIYTSKTTLDSVSWEAERYFLRKKFLEWILSSLSVTVHELYQAEYFRPRCTFDPTHPEVDNLKRWKGPRRRHIIGTWTFTSGPLLQPPCSKGIRDSKEAKRWCLRTFHFHFPAQMILTSRR